MRVFISLFFFLSFSLNATQITVVTEIFPDFQYLDENNKIIGRSVDTVRKALDATDISYSISAHNWSVSYNAVLRDESTCIFSIVRLPNRENKFVWIGELENFDSAIYALKSRHIKINTLNDAKRYKTAVLRDNFSHHYLLERGFSELKNLLLIDNFDKIDKLMTTRHNMLDFIILSKNQFDYRSKTELKLKKLEPVYKLNTVNSPLFFACNVNMDTETVSKLRAGFTATSMMK